jgi:hypothetical protein
MSMKVPMRRKSVATAEGDLSHDQERRPRLDRTTDTLVCDEEGRRKLRKLLPIARPDDEPLEELPPVVTMISRFSPGWNAAKLAFQVYEIYRFVLFDSDVVIPLARRREINRPARNLLAELGGLGGLDSAFMRTLADLAANAPARAGRGRRPGQFSIDDSVRRSAVRLYIHASAAHPGFSINGPLYRFSNAVGELVLGRPSPFTNEALCAEFNAAKANITLESGLELPRRRRGRQTSENEAVHQTRRSAFCRLILQTRSMDFNVGSRDWCYISEQHSLPKGDFDAAQAMIRA